jgi:cytochrome c556
VTPDGIDELLAVLVSASVVGRLEEASPEVWERGLRRFSDADCLTAAADLIQTHRWVKVADVAEAAVAIGNKRQQHFEYQPAIDGSDDDPQRYLQRLRRQIGDIRTGRAPVPALPAALPAEPPKAISALAATIGRAIPAEGNEQDEQPRPLGPLGYECPTCHAFVGRPCRNAGIGKPRPHTHRERRILAAGRPLPTAEELAAEQREIERRKAASRAALDREEATTFVPPSRDEAAS